MSAPYTHSDHARRCRESALSGQVLARQLVQVQKRGITYCAQLLEPWTTPSGLDCWTVHATHPETLRMTVPVSKVRLCGGAFCACSEGPGAEGAPLAGEGPRGGLEGVTC